MKITAVETLRLGEFPNIVWVRVRTDEGLVGLGETFMGATAVEAYIHEYAGPRLIGQDPLRNEWLAQHLTGYLGWRGTGVETRGNSAIDLALWDLKGKAWNQPTYRLLGGPFRDRCRVYNTSAGYRYIRDTRLQQVDNWGLDRGLDSAAGPYEDLDAFLHRADELALSLVEQGIDAMKIWPFDPPAEATGGWHISAGDLRTALEPFERIRRTVGDRMDIMVEFHSLWRFPAAETIARALAPYRTYWHEDPVRMDTLADLRRYAAASPAPVCASETLNGAFAFRELMEGGAVGIIMLDLSWCGGLTEARKIAGMAEAYKLPIAPHDCTGPVVWTASTHLALAAPNALIQESVRAFYTGWYRELVDELPRVENGFISLGDRPGHGLDLLPGLDRRSDAILRVTT
jgi:galactonate dehydratase